MNEELRERLIDLCAGNPGALTVLVRMLQDGHEPDQVFPTLENNDIRGPGIWVLYKDRCGEDLGKFVDMMLRPPANIVEMSRDR